MTLPELRKKSDEQLHALIAEERDKLRALRFEMTTKKIKDVHDLRKIKKRVAQMLTILSQRSMGTPPNVSRDQHPSS